MQVAADDAVARVARRDVARLLDRHLRVRRAGGEHATRAARRSEIGCVDCRRRRAPSAGRARAADPDVAERTAHPRRDVGDRGAGRPVAGATACRCAGSRTRAPAARPGARRSARSRAPTRRRRRCRATSFPVATPMRRRERDEREPERDRAPGPARAPAADARDRAQRFECTPVRRAGCQSVAPTSGDDRAAERDDSRATLRSCLEEAPADRTRAPTSSKPTIDRGSDDGRVVVRDQEGQRVEDAADERPDAGDRAARRAGCRGR